MGGSQATAIIGILDAAGRDRVFIRVGPDHLGTDRGPTITLYDERDTPLWSAP